MKHVFFATSWPALMSIGPAMTTFRLAAMSLSFSALDACTLPKICTALSRSSAFFDVASARMTVGGRSPRFTVPLSTAR